MNRCTTTQVLLCEGKIDDVCVAVKISMYASCDRCSEE
jgi:hypothetical protein